MTKFQVQRSKWLRGEGSEASYLLRDGDRKMCCLGFFAKAQGLSDEDILEERTFEEVLQHYLADTQTLVTKLAPLVTAKNSWGESLYINSEVANRVMVTNDDDRIPDQAREVILKGAFLLAGIEVEFVD